MNSIKTSMYEKTVRALSCMALALAGCGEGESVVQISQHLTPPAPRLASLSVEPGSEEQGPDVRKAEQLCDLYYKEKPAIHAACINMMTARISSTYKKSFTINGITIAFYDKTNVPRGPTYIETIDHYIYDLSFEGIWDESGLLCLELGWERWRSFNLIPFGTAFPWPRDCYAESPTEPWRGDPFKGDKGKLVSLSFGVSTGSGVYVNPTTGRYETHATGYGHWPNQAAWLTYRKRPPICKKRVGLDCAEWVRDPDYVEVNQYEACPSSFTDFEKDCNAILTTFDLENPSFKKFSPETEGKTYRLNQRREYVISKVRKEGMVELYSYYDVSTKRHFLATKELMNSHPAPLDVRQLLQEGWVYPYSLSDIKL